MTDEPDTDLTAAEISEVIRDNRVRSMLRNACLITIREARAGGLTFQDAEEYFAISIAAVQLEEMKAAP